MACLPACKNAQIPLRGLPSLTHSHPQRGATEVGNSSKAQQAGRPTARSRSKAKGKVKVKIKTAQAGAAGRCRQSLAQTETTAAQAPGRRGTSRRSPAAPAAEVAAALARAIHHPPRPADFMITGLFQSI